MSQTTTPSPPSGTTPPPVWPPSIPLPPGEFTIGRAGTCNLLIPHPSVSRTHLKLNSTPPDLELEDLDSRFGTTVNGARVKRTRLRPGDLLRIGAGPPYRFTGSALDAVPDAGGVSLRLADVAVKRDGRTLIDHIDLVIDANTFVGVLGPSGAGKSLLLGCLSSTIEPTTGSITFDDATPLHANLDYFRSKLGIVTQDDLVYTELTVEENLLMAGRIRLPTLDPAPLHSRVSDVLSSVGLLEHRTKKVGVLSGGQRKRVSVAVELLTQPRLLLLDEPTSGLDPGMQARLMEMLRALAHRGVTVVCTTHTLDTLNYFDSVVVLALTDRVASVAFQGNPHELLSAFQVPTLADLFDRLQEFSHPRSSAQSSTPGVRHEPAEEEDSKEDSKAVRALRRRPPPPPPPRATDWRLTAQQAHVVWTRSMLGLTRDRMASLMALVQPVVLALLITLSQAKQRRAISLCFFLVLSAMWLGMTGTVREIVRERKLYIRDRLAGLQPLAYLAGKLLFALSLVATQTLLLWGVARFLGPPLVRPQIADALHHTSFLAGAFAILLVSFAAAALGLMISTLARSERAAVTLLPLVLLPQVILSRLVYGDALRPWDAPSPYSAILYLNKPLDPKPPEDPLQALLRGEPIGDDADPTSRKGALGQRLNQLLSLPMLTRPGTAVLSMLPTAPRNMLLAEWTYLLLLTSAYTASLYFLFRTQERKWTEIR